MAPVQFIHSAGMNLFLVGSELYNEVWRTFVIGKRSLNESYRCNLSNKNQYCPVVLLYCLYVWVTLSQHEYYIIIP